MIFAFPAALLALGAGVALALWSARHEQGERATALRALGAPTLLDRIGALAGRPARRRRVALRIGAIVLAGLALARPQLGSVAGTATRSGRDMLVLLDLSRSMLVADAGGRRLSRAQRIASAEVEASSGDRVGLVVFGGAAFLQLPLTADLAAAQRFVEAASPDAIDDPSTNVASALRLAATTFAHDGGQGSRAVLLLTDGERSEGALDPVLPLLRSARVPVFAVGVGTREGGLVPADTAVASDSGSRWHLDDIGRPVRSRLDEAVLRRIAEATLGGYARWDDPAAMRALGARLRALPARPTGSQRTTERAERFQWPLALAVILLALELLPPIPRLRRPAAIAVVLLAPAALGSCVRRELDLRRAATLYESGRYQEALARYQRVMAAAPEPAVRYNTGNTQYRLKHYLEATKNFREVAAQRPALRQAALFNLGNASVRSAEQAPEAEQREMFDRAIAAYEEVLASEPGNRDAKWNLEVALKKRGDTNSPGSPGHGGRAQAGRGDGHENSLDPDREQAVGAMAGGGQGDAQGESAEELDESRARQLLETIERQQLENHEGRPAARGLRGEHDW